MRPQRSTPVRPGCKRRALVALPLELTGGAETIINLVAHELASRSEWDVEIAVLGRQLKQHIAYPEGNGVRLSYGYGGGKILSEFFLVPRLVRHRYDLVFSSHTRVNSFLAAARSVGLVRTSRLVARESTVLLDRFTGVRGLAYRMLYSTYGSQDMIVAQTGYMKRKLTDVLPQKAFGKLSIVPNPVDAHFIGRKSVDKLSDQDAKIFAERPQIVWCGRLIDVKRPKMAIDVLAELKKRNAGDFGLTMIGAGPMDAELRVYAREQGLAARVNFAGHRDNPFPLFRAAKAGLLTSISEGFPNVILEMMACGVPGIVTTPCAGDLHLLPGIEITEKFGAAELASALMRVIETGDRFSLYGKALTRRSPTAFVDRLLGGDGPA
ncbi:glycosyltransferase [Mesorhizobium muleiense]|uniref:glycosyltransferase n=1 Tax=Mesorhizobium muleiense TaxID=1004279 RepID=UPI001F19592A|nr:glycosyltransferase [Mesorhizobium muleiense]